MAWRRVEIHRRGGVRRRRAPLSHHTRYVAEVIKRFRFEPLTIETLFKVNVPRKQFDPTRF